MSTAFNFTVSRIRSITNDTGKDLDFKDTGKKGLILRVTPSGKKIFRLKAWNRSLKKTEQIVWSTCSKTILE